MHVSPSFKIHAALYLTVAVINLLPCSEAFAAGEKENIPTWLANHVGDNEGQIAEVVLQKARTLFRRKVSEGVVRNPCYFAMDATRPNNLSDGTSGHRFYIICEVSRSFRAISAGHGSGRNLAGYADFSNGKRCAKNFGNAKDSDLTTGGSYITAETIASFKGYYHVSGQHEAILTRAFVQFDGEGETPRPKHVRLALLKQYLHTRLY